MPDERAGVAAEEDDVGRPLDPQRAALGSEQLGAAGRAGAAARSRTAPVRAMRLSFTAPGMSRPGRVAGLKHHPPPVDRCDGFAKLFGDDARPRAHPRLGGDLRVDVLTQVVPLHGAALGRPAHLITDAAAGVLCGVCAMRHRGAARLAWLLVAAGILAWTAGDVYWTSCSPTTRHPGPVALRRRLPACTRCSSSPACACCCAPGSGAAPRLVGRRGHRRRSPPAPSSAAVVLPSVLHRPAAATARRRHQPRLPDQRPHPARAWSSRASRCAAGASTPPGRSSAWASCSSGSPTRYYLVTVANETYAYPSPVRRRLGLVPGAVPGRRLAAGDERRRRGAARAAASPPSRSRSPRSASACSSTPPGGAELAGGRCSPPISLLAVWRPPAC